MRKFTPAETRAEAATKYECFSINLMNCRRVVEQVLGQFGRHGLFSEYTVHDFSHVEEMLKGLDWLIPNNAKSALTDADWLMIVLSIYLHDLGLVVTADEFANRYNTGFRDFCRDILYSGQNGDDYLEWTPKVRHG
jgi:hypothetical protein